MSAERIARAQRELEVHWRMGFEFAQGRERERLFGDVHAEAAVAERRHRQAHALHANAVADSDVRDIQAIDGDHKSRIAIAHVLLLDPSDVPNYSGKHAVPLRPAAAAAVDPRRPAAIQRR